ncbi:MAG: alanine racemase [Steroidobacteraceae bacterium]
MRNTARALINLAALTHNLSVVRGLCAQCRVMAMLKADAYGHGAVAAARALAGANGFAVARLDEALELRESGIGQRILLLPTLLDPEEYALCSRLQIDVTAHDADSVAGIAQAARAQPLRVWLKLDSGMHRLGLDALAFIEADRQLSALSGITELVHMTHFSSTRDMDAPVMARQLAVFGQSHAVDAGREVSVANSATLIARPALRSGWVRPGIMLYGDNPLAAAHPLPLKPVMQLRARVLAVRAIPAGDSVGYDGCWTATRASRIATLGIGYADGYPRHVPNGTPVWINGATVALVGRVSMDSITIDVTDCGGIAVGDEAVLWGPELPAAVIAEKASTATYQLFTGIGRRVTREYIG